MALYKSFTVVPLKIPKAVLGPIPLTDISDSKASFSSKEENPARYCSSSRTTLYKYIVRYSPKIKLSTFET